MHAHGLPRTLTLAVRCPVRRVSALHGCEHKQERFGHPMRSHPHAQGAVWVLARITRPATHPHTDCELPRQQRVRPVSRVHTLRLLCALMLAVSCSSSSLGAVWNCMHIHKQQGCRTSSHACALPAMRPHIGCELPCQHHGRHGRSHAQAAATWAPYEVAHTFTSSAGAM